MQVYPENSQASILNFIFPYGSAVSVRRDVIKRRTTSVPNQDPKLKIYYFSGF
jgi:hypothetical protein